MGNEVMSAGQLLKQANRLKRAGRLDEAIALYHQAIEINPNFAWAYNNLGDALVKQGKWDEAIIKYRRAIEINPNSTWFHLNLGRLFIQQGAFEEAIGYFRQAIEIKHDLLYELSGKYFPLFHSTFEKESCNFCLLEDEDFIKLKEEPIWITLPVKPLTNYCLFGRSSSPQPPTRNQALVQVEFLDENKGLIPSPYSGVTHSQIVGSYFYISTSAEGFSEFKTNIFNTTSLTHYLRLGFRTWYNKKPMILDSKLRLEFDLLLYALEKLSSNHDNSGNAIPYAFLYYRLGNVFFKFNRLDEATFAYQRAIQLYPCFAECHNKLGEAQLKKREHSHAISSFRQAVAINPNKAWYHLNLGEALTKTGGWVATLNCYRSAVKLNPSQIIVHQSSMKIQPDEPTMIQVEQPIFIVGCGHSGTSIMLAILGSHPNLYPIPDESALFLKSESKVREIMLGWDKECTEAGKKRWIEKTPPHIFIIKKLFSYRPNSKFIIMLRDGRDVVCSMKYRTDYEDFNARLDRWIYDNLAGLHYWQHPRVKVVKYENLVTDTELTLKDICNFLGEKYIDSLLEFHKTDRHWYSSEIVKPQEVDMKTHKQFRNWQINQPLFDGRGRWKQEMTGEEKVIFREKGQKYLLEFGYVQDDNWLTINTQKFQAIRSKPIVYPNQPGLEGEVGANINGPSLIRVPDWVKHPLGRYYLYFAHHSGQYIRLAYSNNLQDSWTVHRPGTLHIDQINQAMCVNHIASPDVHIDHQNREIRMYFHGVHPKKGQVSFLASSKDGLHFTASSEILGLFYMRVFQYGGWHYAIAKNENIGGVILRSKDGVTPFERGVDFIPNMRHAAVLMEKDTLIVFYSRIGDAPESILMSHVDLTQKWTSWIPSEPTLVLEPEEDYEGVDLPIKPSQMGAAKERVRQLIDPAVYQEDNKSWLLYSISGESGIAISELKSIIPTLN